MVNFVWQKGSSNGVPSVMPDMFEMADTQSKPIAMRGDSSDKQALAQVEKWMAIIREISREQQAETNSG